MCFGGLVGKQRFKFNRLNSGGESMSHAHNTSIAKSRLGPPRFGRRGDSGGAGPVVTYRLSEEERLALVEKYGPPMDPEKAERIRMKYRTLATGAGRAARGEENKEGGEDGDMPPKLDITKKQIESALRVTKGNANKAIKILQISVGAFYKYVREFGIDVAGFRTPGADPGEAGTEAKAAPREAPDISDSQAPEQETPEKKTAAPEPESAAGSAAGLTSDIFSAWTRVSPQECVGLAAGYISVNAKGAVRFAAKSMDYFSPATGWSFTSARTGSSWR
jgi:hypothetical protein